MNKTVLIILGLVAGLVLVSCVACAGVGLIFVLPAIRGASDRTQRLNDLQQVGLAVHSVMDAKKRGPIDAEELADFLGRGRVAERVRLGDIKVVYDALYLTNQPEGTSKVLIAWDRNPDYQGKKLVLFLDGHTEILAEGDFIATPRARASGDKVKQK